MLSINKSDTLSTTFTFKKDGEPIDISNSTFVVLIKKEGQEDEEALDMKTFVLEDEGKDGDLNIKMNGLDERGEFVICIKALDGDDKYTVKEIPLIIK